jgi:hypothetical protein
MPANFWSGSLKGRDYRKELGIEGRIRIRLMWWEIVDWIHLT